MAASKGDPKRLALWAIAGATLVACAFFVPFLPFPHPKPVSGFWARQWENRLALLSLLAPIVLGGTLWFTAHQRLERGHAGGLWSDAELAPVRDLLAEEYWAWSSVALFALAVLAITFTPHGGGLIYLVTSPGHAASSIRRLLAPPLERTGGLADWKSFKPLHSDSWGKAPTPPTTPSYPERRPTRYDAAARLPLSPRSSCWSSLKHRRCLSCLSLPK